MKLAVETRRNVTVVTLLAESLDSLNFQEFKDSISPIIQESGNLVIDLSHIQFVDSNGLGAIISCLRKVRQRSGRMKLCSLSQQARELCELLRMNHILEFSDSKEVACRGF